MYSFNLPPSAFLLWGLARWSHDHSSTGRPSRHQQGPSTCSFCHDTHGSLMITFPLALSTTTLGQPALTPAASPCLNLRRWHNTVGYSTSIDEANTPQTVRAHILFVGHICDQLKPPSW